MTRYSTQLRLAALLAPLILIGSVELLLRATGFEHAPRRKLLYQPTVSGFIGTRQFFLPTAFSPPGYLWVTAAETELTDRYGFRQPGVDFEKPPDRIRVAFLGGSTTQGGYRPYPERTIRLLNEAAGTNRYEALNAACSSYSIHQSRMAFDRWVRPRRPDLLVLYHGWNDVETAGDGYGDEEKDGLVSIGGDPRIRIPDAVAGLRLTSLMAWILESFDRSWPRQRVPDRAFTEHLDAIALACKEDGIRLVVVVRPRPDRDPASAGIAEIQRRAALLHPHAAAFPADRLIVDLEQRTADGEFGPGIQVFRPDDIHLYEWADEYLAQQLAITFAPEQAAAISNRIDSAGYRLRIARELLADIAPREAAWFLHGIDTAMIREDEASEVVRLREQCADAIPFADLFRFAAFSPELDAGERVAILEQCLAMRPGDPGVLQQIEKFRGMLDPVSGPAR